MARKANVNDLFKIARLLNDLDLKDDFVKLTDESDSTNELGFNIIFKILDIAAKKEVESKVYEVLSGPFEMTTEEVGKVELDTLIALCEECFTLKTVINFIKRVSNKH